MSGLCTVIHTAHMLQYLRQLSLALQLFALGIQHAQRLSLPLHAQVEGVLLCLRQQPPVCVCGMTQVRLVAAVPCAHACKPCMPREHASPMSCTAMYAGTPQVRRPGPSMCRYLLLRKSHLCCMHEGPVLALPSCDTLAGSSLHKTCLSQPPVSAYHAYLGLGRPLAWHMRAHTCSEAGGRRPRGIYVHACPRPRASLGL
eukprot:353839-Chlamydomonas_euryale.AAC.14